MFQKEIHYNIEIEKAVLGICLLESGAFASTQGLLKTEHFYHEGHALVHEALQTMFLNGLPIDLLTVTDHIIRVKGQTLITNTETSYFLVELTNTVQSSAHLEYWCGILQTLWIDRQIILLTSSGASKLSGDTRQKLGELQMKLGELNRGAVSGDFKDMTSLMVQLYQHQDEMRKSKGVGLATGIPTIDRENGGLHNGQMIVLGARPSIGKSAFAGQMAVDVAKQGKRVGIISLEMSNTEIAARLAAIDTDTDFNVLYRGLYRDEREAKNLYSRIASTTSQLPIFVSDKTEVNIHQIRAKAEKLKRKEGLDFLIIDYLQLIDGEAVKGKNREQEVSQISRGCKIMAKEMEIPVMVLCQLNRQSVHRKGEERYPQLSDLRESGSIEQDADVVMFLHRDWMMGVVNNENGDTTEFEADLIGRKWRNGKANWMIKLDFEPTKMKFKEHGGNWRPVQTISEPVNDEPF